MLLGPTDRVVVTVRGDVPGGASGTCREVRALCARPRPALAPIDGPHGTTADGEFVPKNGVPISAALLRIASYGSRTEERAIV